MKAAIEQLEVYLMALTQSEARAGRKEEWAFAELEKQKMVEVRQALRILRAVDSPDCSPADYWPASSCGPGDRGERCGR